MSVRNWNEYWLLARHYQLAANLARDDHGEWYLINRSTPATERRRHLRHKARRIELRDLSTELLGQWYNAPADDNRLYRIVDVQYDTTILRYITKAAPMNADFKEADTNTYLLAVRTMSRDGTRSLVIARS